MSRGMNIRRLGEKKFSCIGQIFQNLSEARNCLKSSTSIPMDENGSCISVWGKFTTRYGETDYKGLVLLQYE